MSWAYTSLHVLHSSRHERRSNKFLMHPARSIQGLGSRAFLMFSLYLDGRVAIHPRLFSRFLKASMEAENVTLVTVLTHIHLTT